MKDSIGCDFHGQPCLRMEGIRLGSLGLAASGVLAGGFLLGRKLLDTQLPKVYRVSNISLNLLRRLLSGWMVMDTLLDKSMWAREKGVRK